MQASVMLDCHTIDFMIITMMMEVIKKITRKNILAVTALWCACTVKRSGWQHSFWLLLCRGLINLPADGPCIGLHQSCHFAIMRMMAWRLNLFYTFRIFHQTTQLHLDQMAARSKAQTKHEEVGNVSWTCQH